MSLTSTLHNEEKIRPTEASIMASYFKRHSQILWYTREEPHTKAMKDKEYALAYNSKKWSSQDSTAQETTKT